MAKIHFVLQGKGGVGKSFVSSLLCQYIMSKNESIIPIDTDPNNTTLLNIKALKTTFLQLVDDDGKFDIRSFDKIIQLIDDKKDTSHFVIDGGATTFIPLIDYLNENEVIEMLQSMEHEIYIHIPIVGGQAKDDTLDGLDQLIGSFSTASIVVWLNEYHGAISGFEDSEFYVKRKEHIMAMIYLANFNKDTFGKDLLEMTTKKMTFEEALKHKDFNLMSKQRLKIYRDRVFTQMSLL